MIGFLFAVLTALVLLAAGFLLGVFWLHEEHARLTVLRKEVEQKSSTMQQLVHPLNADFTSRGGVSSTGRHQQSTGDEIPMS
ncbi:hypothetical protein [Geodermatophilus maliterrae]|uniref:Uncharacterized protein n=1 Tax=Geodermatophilus maliterrae TaxID=3162531 RepID=A0ABV3XCT6_9ACTN